MPTPPDADPPANPKPVASGGSAGPQRSGAVRVSRRMVLRLTSVGVLAGISLVSLYVG